MMQGNAGRFAWGVFLLIFFAYLFGPLILMSISAFNSATYPQVSPWECFTFEWFEVLAADEKLMAGLQKSLLIGFGVVCMSVPIGLAAALVLTQVHQRVRPLYYTVIVSPILIPGVVLGISTLIFWDRLGMMFDADYDSFFYSGTFLTVIGQTTFISAYTMLVFIARLQRFDPVQEEAALDLGASHVQTFTKVLLPFMKPAIASAAVLAFLASFENYNTTVFTIVSESTLTTVLASKVRYGINPSISALAVIIVVLTLIGATVHEIRKRRQMRAAAAEGLDPAVVNRAARATRFASPTAIMIVAITIAGLATVWMSRDYSVMECRAQVAEEKQRQAEERREALQAERQQQLQAEGAADSGSSQSGTADRGQSGGDGAYQNIFAPTNLQSQSGEEGAEEAGSDSGGGDEEQPYGNIFAPSNLEGGDD